MRTNSVAWVLGTIAVLCLGGCRVVVSSSTYESCSSTSDCADVFDQCQSVRIGGSVAAACTRSCATDADCPFGGRCAATDSGASLCLDSCVTDASCELGWMCNAFGSGGSVCTPWVSSGGAPTYSSCGGSVGCSDPADSCALVELAGASGALCTSGCTTDSQCIGGGRCIQTENGNVCLESCLTSGGCESGWSCVPVRNGGDVCIPGIHATGIPPYDRCVPGSTDCQTGTVCATVSPETTWSMCTAVSCTRHADCPTTYFGYQGRCLSFDSGNTFACYEACATTNDCASDFACKTMIVGGVTFDPICIAL